MAQETSNCLYFHLNSGHWSFSQSSNHQILEVERLECHFKIHRPCLYDPFSSSEQLRSKDVCPLGIKRSPWSYGRLYFLYSRSHKPTCGNDPNIKYRTAKQNKREQPCLAENVGLYRSTLFPKLMINDKLSYMFTYAKNKFD